MRVCKAGEREPGNAVKVIETNLFPANNFLAGVIASR